MDAYCYRTGQDPNGVAFFSSDDRQLVGQSTPRGLGLEDGDTIRVMQLW